MSGKFMMTQANTKYALILIAGVGLAGCDDSGAFEMPAFLSGGDDDSQATASSLIAPTTGAARDVEAPEVFSVADSGLWDGRPSLGGVWVAHPDVSDPERVIIRNEANGQFVIGALFRRERENPGPSFQVSSDAAETLGMLAGAPAQLSVVALRREEAPAEPEATAITDFDAPAPVTATSLDVPAAPATDITGNAEAAIAAATAAAAAAETAPTAAAPTPVAAPAQAPAQAPAFTSPLEKPFVQIGIFSVETNANATADQLRANGLGASVLSQSSQGRNFWRVVVGPAPSVVDRAAVLEKVKGLGFTDAYSVTN